MFELLERPPNPLYSPEPRHFIAASGFVLWAVLAVVKLLILYAARFPLRAGVPLGAVILILAVAWVRVYRTYRRARTALECRSSEDETAARVAHYKTQLKRLTIPATTLTLLFWAFMMLRT
jgi:hypothetical protein